MVLLLLPLLLLLLLLLPPGEDEANDEEEGPELLELAPFELELVLVPPPAAPAACSPAAVDFLTCVEQRRMTLGISSTMHIMPYRTCT